MKSQPTQHCGSLTCLQSFCTTINGINQKDRTERICTYVAASAVMVLSRHNTHTPADMAVRRCMDVHANRQAGKKCSPCTCDWIVVASQVSGELLPVWVVAGIATLFLMIKSTTASREKNCKHKQTSPSRTEAPKIRKKNCSLKFQLYYSDHMSYTG